MNKYIKESANIIPVPSKEIFFIIIGNSAIITLFEKKYCNAENVDNEIITAEELSEALKTPKLENYLVKITCILNFITMQETNCMRDHWFFNNIYKMPQEWKNSPVIPIYRKVTNKRWKTIEEFAYYMHVINYVVKL
jgi:hypothetical protein